MQSLLFGMNEKSVIRQGREHYSAIHPTQKPVRLLERLLALVSQPGMTVVDPFSGRAKTEILLKVRTKLGTDDQLLAKKAKVLTIKLE